LSFQRANFGREALTQYRVTQQDIRRAQRYIILLQGTDSLTYRDIAAGCYYATSALLHKVVELRILLQRDRRLLRRSDQQVGEFLHDNEDAHVKALTIEYTYLQQRINDVDAMLARYRILRMKDPYTSEWREAGAVYEQYVLDPMRAEEAEQPTVTHKLPGREVTG
jgi:hypothetical protein